MWNQSLFFKSVETKVLRILGSSGRDVAHFDISSHHAKVLPFKEASRSAVLRDPSAVSAKNEMQILAMPSGISPKTPVKARHTYFALRPAFSGVSFSPHNYMPTLGWNEKPS